MASIDRLMTWLESRIQGLVEGGASWLLPGGRRRRELARWLVKVMRDSARPIADDAWQAPDLFILTLPEAAARRVDDPLLVELATTLQVEARQLGLALLHQPVVRVVADPLDQPPRLQVVFTDSQAGTTGTMEVQVAASRPPENMLPYSGYLIVDGQYTFLLSQPVVTIGRDPRNDLVLEDLRVSRTHAQLRWVQGAYVIFDLQSTGGTSVNGRLVTQHTLEAGDVIALAGVPLVYGQDMPVDGEVTQKLPPEPGHPEVL